MNADAIFSGLVELVKQGGVYAIGGLAIWLVFQIIKTGWVCWVVYSVVKVVSNMFLQLSTQRATRVSLLSKKLSEELVTTLQKFAQETQSVVSAMNQQVENLENYVKKTTQGQSESK